MNAWPRTIHGVSVEWRQTLVFSNGTGISRSDLSISSGFWEPTPGHAVLSWSASTHPSLDYCSIRMSPGPSYDSATATHIKEALFTTADLTGRSLQFGKVHGAFAQKAYIAYVKLVPLTAQQVADLQADRARKETRILQATHNGISYFWSNEYRTREHIVELIEPYRHSDVGKVIWAVNYGDQTNYPTKVGTFGADERAVRIAAASNSYLAGEKAAAVS